MEKPAASATPTSSEASYPVKHGDILPYARQDCSTCCGIGKYLVTLSKTPLRSGEGDAKARICGCALKRFLKVYRGRLGVVKDQLFWAAGKEPEDCYARKELKKIVEGG